MPGNPKPILPARRITDSEVASARAHLSKLTRRSSAAALAEALAAANTPADLVTVQQAAAYCQCTPDGIRRRIKMGNIRRFQAGYTILVPLSDAIQPVPAPKKKP